MVKTKVLLFLFWAAALCAQTPNFQKLTIEDGLSQGMIFDICQTRDGFLWIATKDGLNRYDGYNFKVFTNDAFNPFSLAQNQVNTIFEDSRGWLWLGLDSKGLDVFDPKTGRFHHFTFDFKGEVIVHGTELRRIAELPDGSICALKLGIGLVRIVVPDAWKNGLPTEAHLEKLAKPILIPVQTDVNAQPIPEAILDMSLLQNGNILATSNFRQFLVETKNFTYQTVNPGLVPIHSRWMAQGDEAFGGDLWVGQGAEIRRLRNGEIKTFLPSQVVCKLSLFKGKKGHTWLSLCGNLWDLEPGEDLDFSKPDFTVDASITCIEQDRNGNLWLGTAGYGLRKVIAMSQFFHAGGQGVSPGGIWRNTDGRYFGDENNIIKEYFPATGEFANASFFSKTPLDQLSLAFEPNGDIWLLCKEVTASNKGMLKRYTSDGRLLKTFAFETKVSNADNLFRLQNGMLFVGAGDCRLVRFDAARERFEYFSFARLFGEKASEVRIVALAEGEGGTLWVGTQLGLVKCTPAAQGFDFQLIESNPDHRNGLNNNSIACILPDPADPGGTLWLGTKGGGINRMNIRTGVFQHITTADGLLNNVVYGILPGNTPLSGGAGSGEFWCSTNRGLARILVRKNEPFEFAITTFTAALGLQDNEFNTNAYFKGDNGEMLFGGINGVNRFFPEQLRADSTPLPVYLIGVEINHKKAGFGSPGSLLAQPLEAVRELRLRHDQNNLSFEFAALDFTDPSKNRYRYRLLGLDRDWVETGNLRFAHFNHLAPGTYEFRVQGSNGESDWVDALNSLTIIILPPWWRSRMAYCCYFLLLAWAGWRAYQFQIRRVKEKEQLAFEHRETERVKALEQMKTNFFSNVTHEFRTPLTLMLEPLRLAMPKIRDPEALENVRLAEKNSRKLLALVNQLLDLAKIESGNMSLDLRLCHFGHTVREVFEPFLPLAEKKNIKLTLTGEQGVPAFDFDNGKVELVLNNLISNALKFTPDAGQVKVEIGMQLFPDGLYNYAFVAVKDTGVGIPEDALSKVFDRFYQVDSTITRPGEGTGIGLALSKELAELMGGGILVDSEVGKGSVFTFWLPLKVENLKNREVGDLNILALPGAMSNFQKLSKLKPAIPPGETPVVLVVEDNAELRRFIKKSIGEGWQVVEASNGEEGVKKAIELVPDLVISDLMMPLKSGYELCDELKINELTAHVPIILLTAKSAIESKIKGLRTGADDYLTKPFNTEELLVRMENLVEMRRKLRERFSGKALTATNGEPLGEDLSPPDREFLKKFTVLLETHLVDETLGVEEFAQKMFISRSQLHRKLKALTGRNATDFIKDYRLERAHAMLKNQEGMVAEIALRVGFGNEKYFSTVFKEKYGVSPSQLKQR